MNFGHSSSLQSAVLEIPPGVDIIKWVGHFAQSKNVSVTVLSGSGCLSEVVMCPRPQGGPVKFFERLNLMSLSGFFSMSETSVPFSYIATFAKMDGTVIGGLVCSLVTMAPVVLTMLISNNTKSIGGNSRIQARL